MEKSITKKDIFKLIENIEHPEISKTLNELGMILDISINENIAHVALAIPKFEIPDAVKNVLIECIKMPIENLGFKLNVDFFEMQAEIKENFFTLARANWKGSI